MMRILAISMGLTITAVGGWIGYMWVDTEIPYEYLHGEVVPNPAPQGAQVALPWTIKVNRLCPGNVLRVLFDAETGEMVAAYDRTPSSISVKMGDTRLVKTFQLPMTHLPPRIRYTANVCFNCNALQNVRPICIDTPDLFFSVQQ